MSIDSHDLSKLVSPPVKVWACAALVCAGALLSGCDRDEITAYRAPKSVTHSAKAKPAAVAAPAKVAFDVPPTWRRSDAKNTMRYATFFAGSESEPLEVTVIVLPGDSGGLLPNVNRWRGQINLPPISDFLKAEGTTALVGETAQGVLLDMTGTSAEGAPQRMIAAAFKLEASQTWFVKTTGKPELLDPVKKEIAKFAMSFRKAEPDAGNEIPQSPAPKPAASTSLSWDAPPNWHANPNPSKMLIAEFMCDATPGAARVTVSTLAGDGGGLLANINRWRGQVGLAPVTAPEQQQALPLNIGATSQNPGVLGALFDFVAPAPAADGTTPRMVIAMIADERRSYFVKLTGSAPAVEKEKPAFERFIQTLKLPR